MKHKIVSIFAIIYYKFISLIIYFLGGIGALSHYIEKIGQPIPILKMFGAVIGEGTIIYPGLIIHGAKKDFSNLIIGKNCRILRGCLIDITEKFIMEDNSAISFNCTILTHNDFSPSLMSKDEYSYGEKPVIIRKGSVATTGCILLMGTEIGEKSIVAAGSVVSKKCKDNSFIVGNPARIFSRNILTIGR
jgi:acetyltransferase-like isoleucine patch superfamily enzyme